MMWADKLPEVRALAEAGKSGTEIGRKYGVSRNAAVNLCRREGIRIGTPSSGLNDIAEERLTAPIRARTEQILAAVPDPSQFSRRDAA